MTLMRWYASWKKMVICLKQIDILMAFMSLQNLLFFLDMHCYTLAFMDFWAAYLYTR